MNQDTIGVVPTKLAKLLLLAIKEVTTMDLKNIIDHDLQYESYSLTIICYAECSNASCP
jgi:hypothetical protein